jgi:CheY-like chemotaxis protein
VVPVSQFASLLGPTNDIIEVKVTLPLLREMPRHTDSSTSTTKSIISLSRDVDQSINNLRMQIVGQRVSLTGFDIETKDPILRESGLLLKASIKNFLVSWYGLQVVPLGQKVNIIIANEANPSIITKLAQHAATNHKNHPAIIVLCSQSSRFAHAPDPKETKCHIGFVAKPAGPLKLAKAIIQCLDGDLPLATPGIDFLPGQKEQESNDLSSVFEGLSLSPRGGEVLDNTRMAADSDNARKAIESPTPNGGMEKSAEFPFPNPEEGNLLKVPKSKSAPPATMTEEMTLTASVIQNSTEKENTRPPPPQSNPKPNNNNKNNPRPKLQTPTLLLVDDNNINIQLLGTYLTRRGYETVHEAGNGLEAVNKVESREEGYDVIFMDITMPILDGFGATRRIRGIERHRRERGLPNSDSNAMPNSNSDAVDIGSEKRERGFEQKSGLGNENEREGKIEGQGKGGKEALIIAFTGRSSIEDQTEAVRCGIDLFMTKPVAFKEVGKIIDNWVANKEK